MPPARGSRATHASPQLEGLQKKRDGSCSVFGTSWTQRRPADRRLRHGKGRRRRWTPRRTARSSVTHRPEETAHAKVLADPFDARVRCFHEHQDIFSSSLMVRSGLRSQRRIALTRPRPSACEFEPRKTLTAIAGERRAACPPRRIGTIFHGIVQECLDELQHAHQVYVHGLVVAHRIEDHKQSSPLRTSTTRAGEARACAACASDESTVGRMPSRCKRN